MSEFDYSRAETRDVYRDTEQRMRSDAGFNALVMCLVQHAITQGYTPGELRQAAFAASLYIEMRRPLSRTVTW